MILIEEILAAGSKPTGSNHYPRILICCIIRELVELAVFKEKNGGSEN